MGRPAAPDAELRNGNAKACTIGASAVRRIWFGSG